MGFADRVRDRIRTNAWLTVGMAIYPAILLLLCLGPAPLRGPSVVMPVLFCAEVGEKIVIALIGTIFATLYVRAISNEVRGRFTGIIGVTGGIVGVLVGLLSSLALKWYGYPHGFTLAFAAAVGLLLVASFAVRHVKELPELCAQAGAVAGADGGPSAGRRDLAGRGLDLLLLHPLRGFWQVVRMREFRLLAPPNILRGVGDGAGFFAMAIGMKQLGLGNEYAGYTTSLIYLAGILGTLTIGLTVDRFGPGRVLLGADAAVALSLIGLVLAPSPLFFLTCFLMWQVFALVEGATVPLAHYAIVPIARIGAFSGVRLMILYGANAVGTYVAGELLDIKTLSPVFVFAGCASLKLLTGFLYWDAFRRGTKYAVGAPRR